MNSETPETPESRRPPLIILGCMKTGTTLPLALLDGHPDLLVLPAELNYFRYTDHPSLFPERKFCNEPPGAQLTRKVLDGLYFLKLLNKDRLAKLQGEYVLRTQDVHDFSSIDPAAFEECVERGEPGASHRSSFLRFFQGLLAGTGRDPGTLSDYHFVEKSPLQEEYAPLLKRWFPTARFLHLVRNPYATLRALRIVGSKSLVKGERVRYPYLRDLCASIGRSVRLGQWAQTFLPDYRMIRYEDLVLKPEETMRSVAKFLGIPFDPVLLSPTLAGKPWGGNSMQGDAFRGIEPSAVERWREDITPFEVALVNARLGGVLRDFEYERVEPRSRLRTYLPQRRERLLTWIANRVLLGEPGEL